MFFVLSELPFLYLRYRDNNAYLQGGVKVKKQILAYVCTQHRDSYTLGAQYGLAEIVLKGLGSWQMGQN